MDCNHSFVVWPNWKERWCNPDKWVAICRVDQRLCLVQLGNIWLLVEVGQKTERGEKRRSSFVPAENQDFEYTFPTNWHPNLELFLLLKFRCCRLVGDSVNVCWPSIIVERSCCCVRISLEQPQRNIIWEQNLSGWPYFCKISCWIFALKCQDFLIIKN